MNDPRKLDGVHEMATARKHLSDRFATAVAEPGASDAAGSSSLSLENVNTYYGSVHALKDVSITIKQGEVVTIIGCNGAGKSTTLRTISGLLRPRSGRVVHQGTDISVLPASDIVGRGIVHSPEGRRIFADMTVFENLQIGAYLRNDRVAIAADLDRVYELFPRLKERAAQRAGTLSGGEQQMLAIGRALMASPRILLLDEPSLGLAPVLVQQIFATIRKLNAENGLTILLVEQNATQALKCAHRAYVLETGRVIMSGPAAELAANPDVQKAYLGG
ncbi:MAG: ABC transporter ATP-binding protein [Planctomycetota bacterium]